MKRRFYALMLVVAMLAMTLVGCGSDTSNTTNTTNDVTVNTEVEESGDDVVVESTEDPVATPEVDEEVVVSTEESETPKFSYELTLAFPDGMEGFTRKYLNEEFEDWSLNETHYVATNGTEMNFTWEGPATLGENATAGESSLYLYGEDNYNLRAWNGGELKLEELEECLAFEKSVWTSLSGSDVSYPEDGYYNVERIDNIVYVKYAVKTDTMNGYSCFICNGDAGNYYMFTYLERNEIYDDTRAMNVVNSIAYWDNYTPLDTTTE